ncbi:hypothetical protein Tco_1072991, partial [Tanacetum coccineum]
MKQGWCGQAYKDLLWRATSAINVRDFEKCMLELKTMNPKAHEWLNKIRMVEQVYRSRIIGLASFSMIVQVLHRILALSPKEVHLMKVHRRIEPTHGRNHRHNHAENHSVQETCYRTQTFPVGKMQKVVRRWVIGEFQVSAVCQFLTRSIIGIGWTSVRRSTNKQGISPHTKSPLTTARSYYIVSTKSHVPLSAIQGMQMERNEDTLNFDDEAETERKKGEGGKDVDATEAVVTPDLERKSDETEEVIIEEKDTSDVKSGDTEELDLERIQSTARQSTVTPRTLDFDDEAGPSSPIRPTQEEEPEEQFKDDEFLADLNRTRGLSIPGPMQSQPQQPTQATDPKEKGKGILVEEPKKKKLTLQQIRALETKNDEEVARKIQAEWDAEEERKRLEALKKPKTILKKPTSLVQERNQMMSFLKGQGYKNLQKLKYPQMKELYDKVQESIKDSFKDFIPMGSEKEKQMLQERDAKRLLRKRKVTVTEEQPSKKLKLRTETIDELRNYLRIVDFEQSAQDRESLEAISMITEFKVIDSPDGEYLIIFRANNHFRAFNTLWEILHILDRQDLYHLYLVVQDYYKHIPPTGLGLILLGDLTTIWETSTTSDDDFWKNQEDWEIVRWRLNESSGVHTLELEDGTMIHMLTER